MYPSTQKRLFIAIRLSVNDEFLKNLNSLKQNLVLDKISWVKPDNFHLTLKFLGKTFTEKIPEIQNAMKEAGNNLMPFDLSLDKLGIFGSSYNPKVIWVETEKNQQVFTLSQQLLHSLEKAGFSPDRQNFVPHFTLGRIRKLKNKSHFQNVMENHKNVFHLKQTVSQFILYESKLTPSGPVYNPLFIQPL